MRDAGTMRRLALIALGLASGTAVAAGCGSERAIVALVRTDVWADHLCVVAYGEGSVVFSQAYTGREALVGGSLTFVAGDTVQGELAVTARATRGGAVVAAATTTARFADSGFVEIPLDVQRCHPRAATLGAPELRRITMVSGAGASPTIAAIDVDGDGRDEIVIVGDAGALSVVDADVAAATVRTLALSVTGAIAGASDSDTDCALEAVVPTADGVRVARALDGDMAALDAALGPEAVDAAVGDVGLAAGAVIAVAGPDGATLLPVRGGGPMSLGIRERSSIAVGDLTGDGIDDIVASGAMGTTVWLAGGAGPTEAAGALPASFDTVTGPIEIGDIDGNGILDLVGAAGAVARIAYNTRGDAFFADRSGAAPPTMTMPIRRLLFDDVDGDCVDDLVLVDAGGAAQLFRGSRTLQYTATDLTINAADAVIGDFDGDGARDLAVLEAGGELSLWP